MTGKLNRSQLIFEGIELSKPSVECHMWAYEKPSGFLSLLSSRWSCNKRCHDRRNYLG